MMENSNQKLPASLEIQRRVKTIEELCERMTPFGFSGTVFISHDNNILLNKGYGYRDFEQHLPMQADTIMSLGSVSKQMTAVLILQLLDQGLLSLDDTLDQYLSLSAPAGKLTLHTLLNHTSGLPSILGFDFDEIHPPEFLKLVDTTQLEFDEAGSQFSYSNVGYSLLALVVEKISNTPFINQLQQLFNSVGITSGSSFGDPRYNSDNAAVYYVNGERQGAVFEWAGNWDPDHPRWHLLGNGGVCINHQDMYIYLQALFKDKLISDSALSKMITPGLNDYGYGWDIIETPLGTMIRHDGGSDAGVGHITRYYTDLDLTVLISSNTILNGKQSGFVVEDILQMILDDEPVELPPYVTPNLSNEVLPSQTYQVSGIKEHIRLQSLPYSPMLLSVESQALINKLLHIDPSTQLIYEKMNNKLQKFGKHMLQRQWDLAFQAADRKTENEERIETLENLIHFFEEQEGKLDHIQIGGTIPSTEFLAETSLQLVSTLGKKAVIPFVWKNPQTFLGFYPLLRTHVLLYLAVFQEDMVIAYSPISYQSVRFSYDSTSKTLTIL